MGGTGSSPMKEKFVALHMPSNSAGGTKSTSIWRRWNRLTACQKRSLIVVLVLLVTTYAVGEQLHELHLKSKKIENIKHIKILNTKTIIMIRQMIMIRCMKNNPLTM